MQIESQRSRHLTERLRILTLRLKYHTAVSRAKSAILYQYFDEVTGYQIRTNKRYYKPGEIMTYEVFKTDGAAVVIIRDNRAKNGFRVETSYPITQDGVGND